MAVFRMNYLKKRSNKSYRPYLLMIVCSLCHNLIITNVKAGIPPASLQALDSHMQLYLELVINNLPTHHIAAVDSYQDNYYIALSDLEVTGVSSEHWHSSIPDYQGKIALNHVKDVQVKYDSELQILFITVPASWLPDQKIDTGEQRTFNRPQTSLGALFNYDVYATKPKHESGYVSTWTEFRVFGEYGALSSTGNYRQDFEDSSGKQNGYIRYDTSWDYTDEERLLTLETGDFITRTPAWVSPVRMGGIQLSHNFAVRPDIITYPLPEFSGENSLPSTVDLLVNGYKAQSYNLDPGPFTLSNIPYINGAGTATL